MFLNYEILSKGYQAIFLGQSIPIFSLKDLIPLYDNIVFVTYFTVQPDKEQIMEYLKEFYDMLLKEGTSELWLLGRMLQEINGKELPKTIVPFSKIEELVQKL
jgi:hypothetical protein